MLPAKSPGSVSLADVLVSMSAALGQTPEGRIARIALPPVTQALVVVVDGLGAAQLAERSAHARVLAGAPGKPIASGFPTTTATALTSLATGAAPGEHGIVGYDAFVPGDGVRNQLRQWQRAGGAMDPALWQREHTVFERVPGSVVIAEPKYAASGFTKASLRGAQYLGGKRLDDRLAIALDQLGRQDAPLVYLYVPELDRVGHASGVASDAWIDALERVDGAVAELARALPRQTGMLVTADHGMVDVPQEAHTLVPEEYLDGVSAVAGEPRCLQVQRESDTSEAQWERCVERWRELADVAWVATRAEVLEAGWFGATHPSVLERMGDLFVAARKRTAFYVREDDVARGMIGQHGSLTPEELRVPLARFGAFAD